MQYSLFSAEDLKQETPFTGRTVCALGVFRRSPKALQGLLQRLGADYRAGTRVSRNVHYVLMGHKAVPQDQLDYLHELAFHGYQPRVLNENDLDLIAQGHYRAYVTPQEMEKDLHLSFLHYTQCRLNYLGDRNLLYMKELYVAPDILATWQELYQALGDRGIYANAYIDETTEVLVVSDQTLQHLHDGITDKTIRYVEKTYNDSRMQTFRYNITSETELLRFLSKN